MALFVVVQIKCVWIMKIYFDRAHKVARNLNIVSISWGNFFRQGMEIIF
jgi:hypothetical protein